MNEHDEAEEWRPVFSWPEELEVSNLGRIRSHDTMRPFLCHGKIALRPIRGRIMRQKVDHYGYAVVHVRRHGKNIPLKVHRAVGEAFIGPLPKGMQTRHLDGNGCNNFLSNLAYGTPMENSNDADRHGRRKKGEDRPHKLKTSDVLTIRARFSTLPRPTFSGVAREYGVACTTIEGVVKRWTWRHVE